MKDRAISRYLEKRAELGRLHFNDRESNDKLWADAVLRGQIGERHANEVIEAIDDLRARGFR